MIESVLLNIVLASVLALPVQLPPVPAPPPAPAIKLTEVEQLRLQVLVERQRRVQAQFDTAMNRCQAQTPVRLLLDEADQIQKDENGIIEAFFDAHKVDRAKFKLNPETGEFIAQ